MPRVLCDQSCLCLDFRAFENAYFQTFMCSKPKIVRSKMDNLYVHVQTIMGSKDPMPRLLCVQSCLCPDFSSFENAYVQTFVRSLVFPDRLILNARHPLARSFWSGHINFRSGASAWVVSIPRDLFSQTPNVQLTHPLIHQFSSMITSESDHQSKNIDIKLMNAEKGA